MLGPDKSRSQWPGIKGGRREGAHHGREGRGGDEVGGSVRGKEGTDERGRRRRTKKNFFMSFSFEFQIFSLPLCRAVRLCSEQAKALFGEGEGKGRGATGVRVRLIEHSTVTPFESGNDRVREQNDGDDEDDDDGDAMAENFSKVIFNFGSFAVIGFCV